MSTPPDAEPTYRIYDVKLRIAIVDVAMNIEEELVNAIEIGSGGRIEVTQNEISFVETIRPS